MNAEKRKALRNRVQAHPSIASLRKQIFNAAARLPEMLPVDESIQPKRETLVRRFLGGKMPKRIVLLHRGYYAIRPCVSGVVFTVAVFPSLGGRENHKLAAPMSRLSDAIAYHFRASRMRSVEIYNYSVEQAKADAEVLHSELEELSKLLVECGVPVMGNPISAIKFPDSADNRIALLETYCSTLEARITALEFQSNLRTSAAAIVREKEGSGYAGEGATTVFIESNCKIPSSF